MITAGWVRGPFSRIPVFATTNSTANKLLLIRFLGTFLRVSSLSPTTYSSDMSESGMWLKRGTEQKSKQLEKLVCFCTTSHPGDAEKQKELVQLPLQIYAIASY